MIELRAAVYEVYTELLLKEMREHPSGVLVPRVPEPGVVTEDVEGDVYALGAG